MRGVARGAASGPGLLGTQAVLRGLAVVLAAMSIAASAEFPEIQVERLPDRERSRLNLAEFYEQFASADGIPIVASGRVRPEAVAEAAWIVSRMLARRPDVARALAASPVRVAVMAHDEFTTDIPEHADLRPAERWNRRARGLGATDARPAVSCGEENLLCFPGDPYVGENILVHEFAHTVHEIGLRAVDPTLQKRLEAAFAGAKDRDCWRGTYALTNPAEYWAEGVQSWLGCNRTGGGIHGPLKLGRRRPRARPAPGRAPGRGVRWRAVGVCRATRPARRRPLPPGRLRSRPSAAFRLGPRHLQPLTRVPGPHQEQTIRSSVLHKRSLHFTSSIISWEQAIPSGNAVAPATITMARCVMSRTGSIAPAGFNSCRGIPTDSSSPPASLGLARSRRGNRRGWMSLAVAGLIAWLVGEPAAAQITSTASYAANTNWTALSWSAGAPAAQDTAVLNRTGGNLLLDANATVGNLDWITDVSTLSSTPGNSLTFSNGSLSSLVRIGRGSATGLSAGRAWLFHPDLTLQSDTEVRFHNIEKGVTRRPVVGGIVADGTAGPKSLTVRVQTFGGGGTGTHQWQIGQTGGGANTFAGGLVVSNSANTALEIYAGKAHALGSGPLVFSENTGNTTMLLQSFSQTVGGLASTSNPAISSSAATTLSLALTDGSSRSFAGRLTGSMGLGVTGAGTQILAGTNTYTGPTSVLGGVLAIASTGSIDTTSGVTVNGANAVFRYDGETPLLAPLTLTQGTLTGTGTIASAFLAGSGSRLSPGNSPGIQAFSNGLQLAGQGSYLWEIGNAAGTVGTGWDLIDVTGGVLNLSGLDGGAASTKYALDLMTLDGATPGPMAGYDPAQSAVFKVFSTAAGGVLLPGSVTAVGGEDVTALFLLGTGGWANTLPSGGFEMRVSAGGTGIDLVSVVAVPEPASLAVAAGGLAALGLLIHRRRRSARS